MSSHITKTFKDTNFSIEKEGNKIWWWGEEVANMRGYVECDKAVVNHVDECERRKKELRWQVNECGLYNLIFSNKLPLAKEFQKWVFQVVLPSIHKTYQTPLLKHNQLSIRSEDELHHEVIKEIRKRFPQFMLVVQMGELQDTSEKRIGAWKKGFSGGQPDIMITNPHKLYNGLCIELKNPDGTGVVSDKQKDVLALYDSMGWKTLICDDLIHCMMVLVEYDNGISVVCDVCRRSFVNKKNLKRHKIKQHK